MKQNKAIGLGLVAVGTVVGIVMATRGKATGWGPIPPADIEVSNLVINPAETNLGQDVNISCTVTNFGGTAGSYEVTLGGDFMATKNVSLNPGESKQVQFTVTPTELGTYHVAVDGLSGSFEVTEESVANIQLSNLVVTPVACHAGDTVVITVTATNNGEARGSRDVVLNIT